MSSGRCLRSLSHWYIFPLITLTKRYTKTPVFMSTFLAVMLLNLQTDNNDTEDEGEGICVPN
jgi:hypothetical protein